MTHFYARRAFFNIFSVRSNLPIEIGGKRPGPGSSVRTWDRTELDSRQQWEFVIPVVDVPAGWLRIQNICSGGCLTHKYLTSPPFLSPTVHATQSSQELETWPSQWRFLRRSPDDSETKGK